MNESEIARLRAHAYQLAIDTGKTSYDASGRPGYGSPDDVMKKAKEIFEWMISEK